MRLLRALAPATCLLAVLVTRPAPFAALRTGAETTLHRTLGEDNIVCRVYLDPHDKFTRVVAPERAALAWTGAAEAEAILSTISVNYTGFTGNAPAQAAFQAAVDIWKTQVASTVPIVIDANFQDLGNPLLLGQAGSYALSDFLHAPRAGTWFPFPLANKLAGSDQSAQFGAGAANIGASFNSTANWYYGTDGLVPSGKVDFESVVLHELGHGLGFFGAANVSAGSGRIGSSGFPYFPYIYDTFTVDALTGGNSLLNTTVYPNPGATLAAALTGNSLYWNGASGKSANAGARPRLYAPATFSNGSTFSHLDESTYPAGNINSLMTPQIGTAEAIHTPGPIMLGMFADMGWGSQCSLSIDRATQSVGAAGASFTVSVSSGSGCAWTASTAATFVTTTAGASGSGSGTVSLTVAADSSVSFRTATVAIAGNTFTITQNGTGPTMSLDKTLLIFSAVNSGAAFTSQTGAQAVRLLQSGAGTVTWTASSSAPSWLSVSPASGSGSATLTISTQFASGLAATQTGTITLSFTGAGRAAGPITVTLNSLNGAQVAPPVGSFDTPTAGSTGVTGSIAVTGWAMDDVQATRVRIMRDPVAGETPGVLGFDSTVLTNGVHTIAWLVTDNLGSASGIGSRYFTVANGALYLDPSQSGVTASGGSRLMTGPTNLSMPRAAALRFDSASALAGEIDAAPADTRAIDGRRGYDMNAPLRAYSFRDAVATIQSEELDRIELRLSESGGHTYAGYLRVGDSLAPLPIGSSLNAATGAFTWQPGVAFVGKYDLVFVRWSGGRAVARQNVCIVLNPKGSNRVGPQVVIDTPRQQQDVAQPFVIAGWAADLDSTIDGLAPGTYDLAVFAYSTVTGGFVPAKTVRLTVR